MRIDLIGAGSLGLLLGGKLASTGNDEIRLWCRGEQQAQELKRKGITVSYEDDRESLWIPGDRLDALATTGFVHEYLQSPSDWIILMVKQNVLHTELVKLLAPLHNYKPHILCFQNGSGHMEMLQELLPEAHLYAAVTTEAAKVKSKREVIHAGTGETWVGLWHQSKIKKRPVNDQPEAISLLTRLNSAGFLSHLSNEVESKIYRKLLINAIINPLTAIWRIPNGELLSSSSRMQLMRELYEEAITVFDAVGIDYDANAWENVIQVCQATAGNTSSMLADVLAGRATEIRWINGNILDMADRSGVAVPAHRWICRVVEGMNVEKG
ncbi:ketopantoate reductase family protein [Paenibacillus wynnii]|uniref:ketopantoate reductase family protein n=1 Tax=Paenibacillus wynnii TaxID=268407 RepID=UPI0027934284|nr:2-dehydropantoate 2-reductase [Paenibacillus wynnii]MDQ0192594.1 2-dehydropantoate 2-reductase [Paenibacillus wynnii]